MPSYYNAHTHIFSADCAPRDFLKVGLNIGDKAAATLEWMLRSKVGQLFLKSRLGNSILGRQAEFVRIGTMKSQFEVFENNLLDYDASSPYTGIKFVTLTLDMDYMADAKYAPDRDFEAQLWDIITKVKPTYPNRVFPFLGVDPRNPRNLDFDKNIKRWFDNKTFAGIKLYPSHGFFPFDPRLDKIYKYAADNNIPVMTHCTRTGSFYIGSNVWSLIPQTISSLEPNDPAMTNIINRISLYRNTSDKKFRENLRVCNLFLHPENYIPVLNKYPNLKICFAHLGGVMEVLGENNKKDKKTAELFKDIYQFENAAKSWYEWICDILAKYPNTYSDISYSLHNADAMDQVKKDLVRSRLPSGRILFGTDYFMVEQEAAEQAAIKTAQENLSGYFTRMITDNPKNYLSL